MSISLTDGKNWSTQFNIAGCAFDGKTFTLPDTDLSTMWNSPLDKVNPKDLGSSTITFSGDTPLPLSGAKLTLKVSMGASVGEQIGGSLFGSGDPFDQSVALNKNCCLWLKMSGSADVNVAGIYSGFGIGIDTSANSQYSVMQIFEPSASGSFPLLSEAFQRLLAEASPPTDLESLTTAAAGSIFEFDCGGSVKLTGSYSLPSLTIPLATSTVPVLKEKLTVSANGKLGVSGSFEISGSFIFRIYKPNKNSARFQLLKKTGTTLDIKLDGSVGVTGGASDKDFIESVIKAISPDLSNFDLGARDPALNAQLKKVLQDAISTQMAISLTAEANLSHSTSTLFSTDIDLQIASQTSEMSNAVNAVFNGDWTLAKRHDLKCVTAYQDTIEKVTTSEHAFHFHLLNIFSATSVTDFLTSAKVMRTQDGVIFTDHNTASQIQVIGNIADPKSLSNVLAQALEATLVFKATNGSPAMVDLQVSGHSFQYEANGSKDDLTEISNVSEGLDCPLAGLNTTPTRVGVLKFDAGSTYDPSGSDACFVGPSPDYAPKSRQDYIAIAKSAIALLYSAPSPFYAAITDDQLWSHLNTAGSASAMIADPYVQAFLRKYGQYDGNAGNIAQVMWLYSIWYTVTFWSNDMANYAQLLQKAKKMAAMIPVARLQGTPELQSLMGQLAATMQKAQNEQVSFIDARAQFGLVAFYLASGRQATNQVFLTWNSVTQQASNRVPVTLAAAH